MTARELTPPLTSSNTQEISSHTWQKLQVCGPENMSVGKMALLCGSVGKKEKPSSPLPAHHLKQVGNLAPGSQGPAPHQL